VKRGQRAGSRLPRIRRAAACLMLLLGLSPQNPIRAGAEELGRINPNTGLFPDSSLADFRFLLDPPAGKHGFLRISGQGRFIWLNGQRARFWGVNISNRSVWIDKPTIDCVVATLARAGTNMVRFEALDSFNALLEVPGTDTTRTLNPERLEILDYWTAKLRAQGIYYYFNLIDFRSFKAGDGVAAHEKLGRAAKPYAVFDRTLIDRQKEFARQLLTHQNRYTGLRYVDDPALALVEICNEHGFFLKADSLDSLAEPYKTALQQQWNGWLLFQYESRDNLKRAWGEISETGVLGEGEDPERATVRLPLLTAAPSELASDPSVIDVRRAPARVRDGIRFLHETQRLFFREMKEYLREIGVKVPITGVVSAEYPADVASVAAELDFTSQNYYADHPSFTEKGWEGEYFYRGANPLRASSAHFIAPWLTALRWENKPVVVREFATVWPNRYRAIAIPEMLAYAGLQDFDAVLLFGYQTSPRPDVLGDFDHQADPTVWGLFALGSLAFQRGDIRPATRAVQIAYTPDTLFQGLQRNNPLLRLSWFVRVINTLREPEAVLPLRPNSSNPMTVRADQPDALEAILDIFGRSGQSFNSKAFQNGILRSETGETVRLSSQGMLTLITPRAVAACGEFPTYQPITLGNWTLITPTPVGALMIVSLDGKPLIESQRFSIKMVSRAENTEQLLERAPDGSPSRLVLKNQGRAPVITYGRAAHGATIVRRGNETIISLGMMDGTWELLVREGKAALICDTPGIRVTLFGQSLTTVANAPLIVDQKPIVSLP
jgi:hypothetical protein